MIEPRNRKLRNFHLLLAVCFYIDFFLTGFIIGNYPFLEKQDQGDPDFLYHRNMYFLIILVQSTDILLNFFKIQTADVKEIREPSSVAINYLKSSFLTDFISVLPYSVINPKLIFLRYLKIMKFRTYQGYFDEFFVESM